jgi:hypothetical protein
MGIGGGVGATASASDIVAADGSMRRREPHLGQRAIFGSSGARMRSFDPHEPQVTTIMDETASAGIPKDHRPARIVV